MRRVMQKIRRGAIASVDGFSPLDLAGLGLWLDSSNSTSVTKDGSNLVSQWTDLSGNGHNFTGSGAAKPLCEANQLNGNPGIYFDGSNDFLTATGQIISAASASYIYVIFKQNGWGADTYPRMLKLLSNTAANSFSIGWPQSDTSYGPTQLSCGDYKKLTYIADTSVHKLLVEYNGSGINPTSSWSLKMDGSAMTFGTTPGGLPTYTVSSSLLGCSETAGSNFQFWKGHIFEVIAGIGTLTTDELDNLAAYVLQKWGI